MKNLPRTITNPINGETVTFIKTARETGGAYILVEVELSPGGGVGMHYHTAFTEHFEAVEGRLGIQSGGQTLFLKPGETADVPLRVRHRFFNPSADQKIRFRTTISPARQFEEMLRIIYGLARDGKTNDKGMPNIWHMSIVFQKGESYMPNMPIRFQKAVFGLIAKIARLMGKHKELYPYYKPAKA